MSYPPPSLGKTFWDLVCHHLTFLFWSPGQLLSFQLRPWAPSHRLILIALRSSSSTMTSITAGTSQLKQSGIMRTVLHVCLSVRALKLLQVSFIFYLVCFSRGLFYAPVCFLFVLICVCLLACLFYQLVFNKLQCMIVSSRGWHKATCETPPKKNTWTTFRQTPSKCSFCDLEELYAW